MFFEVAVVYTDVVDTKLKKFRETYLAEAVSVTDAEAMIVNEFSTNSPTIEFEVKAVRQSKILKVIYP